MHNDLRDIWREPLFSGEPDSMPLAYGYVRATNRRPTYYPARAIGYWNTLPTGATAPAWRLR